MFTVLTLVLAVLAGLEGLLVYPYDKQKGKVLLLVGVTVALGTMIVEFIGCISLY